jgi:hypothetical protein
VLRHLKLSSETIGTSVKSSSPQLLSMRLAVVAGCER